MNKTIKNHIETQIVEKKSKFIANVYCVHTQEEAEEKINSIRKKYYDARHHCFAFNIMTKDGLISKSSDDGEPSGTAGAPMLNILQKNEIINVLVIVTRYFGGILLGTGGLVKAYSEATMEAISKSEFVSEKLGMELEITINYNDFEKFNYYCNKNNINIIDVQYYTKVNCIIEVDEEEKQKILSNNSQINFNIENYKEIKQKNIRKNIEK